MANEQLLPWINSAGAGGERNSMVSFAGDGSTTTFEFNFAGGYIARSDVKAYLYDDSTGLTTDVPLTDANFINQNTLNVTPAPSTGIYLVIYRDTQKTTPLVDYSTNAVMDESNLDTSNKQAVFIAAEMVDRFDAINASSADAIERSFAAVTTANEAKTEADAANTASASAVSTAAAAQASAAAAVSTANDAHSIASGIDGKATTALSNSEDAVSTANSAASDAATALSTATGIDGKATSALSQAASAVATANAAQTTADAALPEVATAPTTDQGPIYVPGVGIMEWDDTVGAYVAKAGGATGGGADQVFYLNGDTITQDFTVPEGKNAMSAGPIEITGAVTVEGTWVIL